MNEDDAINAADIVGIVNVIQPSATPSAREQLLADANDDGMLDSADADYAINVTLQLAEPLPLIQTSATAVVSFWRPAEIPAATERDVVFEHPVSFWRPAEIPAATERDVVFEHPASFWRPAEIPAATERDAVFEHPASFWRPDESPAATEDNAFLEAAVSFERQVAR